MSRKGIPNKQYDECDVEPSRCKKCGSTERSAYRPMAEALVTRTPSGLPATHAVWRACECKNCKQTRRDVFFENRILEEKSPSSNINTTIENENVDEDVLF